MGSGVFKFFIANFLTSVRVVFARQNLVSQRCKSCFSLIFAAIPQHLVGFTMDPSLPTDQEFLLLTVEGLSAIVKDVGGEGGFLHVQTEWNCHAQVLDYGDLTYKPLLSPFDVGLTMALYHEGRVSRSSLSHATLVVRKEKGNLF